MKKRNESLPPQINRVKYIKQILNREKEFKRVEYATLMEDTVTRSAAPRQP
jgi:hypothetical protein